VGRRNLRVSGPPSLRNRAQFQIATENRLLRVRLARPDSRRRECPISSPRLNQALAKCAPHARPRFPNFVTPSNCHRRDKRQVNILETTPVAKTFYEWCQSTVALIRDHFRQIPRQPRSFFQVNRFLIDQLVEAPSAMPPDNALDLYSGVGLFALRSPANFKKSPRGVRRHRRARPRSECQNAGLDSAPARRVEDHSPCPRPRFRRADPPAPAWQDCRISSGALKPPRLTSSLRPRTLARDVAAHTVIR